MSQPYAARHRSVSIPVTPEGHRSIGSKTRHSNGGYLSLPNCYPTLDALPRSAPDLTGKENQQQMKPRNATELITETPTPRRQTTSARPRHNRSLSFRTMKRPTQQQLQEDFRPRVSTMPSDSKTYLLNQRRKFGCGRSQESTETSGLSLDLEFDEPAEEEYYLLRNFTITSKGIVNHGDLVRQRSRSNNSVASTTSSLTGGASSVTSCSSGHHSSYSYRVLILGALGVGKTSLVTQFMTSEYMNTYDGFESDDNGEEKFVSVLLDREEYDLTIIDSSAFSDLTDLMSDEVDAYIIVYSVTDRHSFEKSVDILFALRDLGYTVNKAVILVGNKSDLVRSRVIAIEEGKSIACSYECKFIETSAGINHKVDELLVGVVSQIRLKCEQKQELTQFSSPTRGRKRRSKGGSLGSGGGQRVRGLISRLLGREGQKSKSCDNLHVL